MGPTRKVLCNLCVRQVSNYYENNANNPYPFFKQEYEFFKSEISRVGYYEVFGKNENVRRAIDLANFNTKPENKKIFNKG